MHAISYNLGLTDCPESANFGNLIYFYLYKHYVVMKKIYYTLFICLSVMCLACNNKRAAEVEVERGEVAEADSVETGSVEEKVVDIPLNERFNHHLVYDLSTYTKGDYIFICKEGYAPCNEAVTVLDKQGRMLAVAGSASESQYFGNFIRYLYDEDGKHIGFARKGECDYPENMETFFGSAHFDMLYYDICVRKPDDAGLVRYMFKYNDAGILKGIYDPIKGYALNAPEGAYIQWRIEEGANFWISDLNGANYYLLFFIMPLGQGFIGNSLCYDVYDGYLPYDYEGDEGQ